MTDDKFAAERDNLQARCAVLESIARAAVEYRCPTCAHWAVWTDGRSISVGDDTDEYWCQACGTESALSVCDRRSVVRRLTAERDEARAGWAKALELATAASEQRDQALDALEKTVQTLAGSGDGT